MADAVMKPSERIMQLGSDPRITIEGINHVDLTRAIIAYLDERHEAARRDSNTQGGCTHDWMRRGLEQCDVCLPDPHDVAERYVELSASRRTEFANLRAESARLRGIDALWRSSNAALVRDLVKIAGCPGELETDAGRAAAEVPNKLLTEVRERDAVIDALRGSEQSWQAAAKELETEVRNRDAVVEAAKVIASELQHTPTPSLPAVADLLEALDLAQPTAQLSDAYSEVVEDKRSEPTAGAEVAKAQPARTSSPSDDNRPILVGSLWVGKARGVAVKPQAINSDGSIVDDDGGTIWTRSEWLAAFSWLSDPEPTAGTGVPEPGPDEQRGLYRKYRVERLNDSAGKHKDCTYFVLDEVHDKYAGPALRAYADSCELEYPELASDLRARHPDANRKPCPA